MNPQSCSENDTHASIIRDNHQFDLNLRKITNEVIDMKID